MVTKQENVPLFDGVELFRDNQERIRLIEEDVKFHQFQLRQKRLALKKLKKIRSLTAQVESHLK